MRNAKHKKNKIGDILVVFIVFVATLLLIPQTTSHAKMSQNGDKKETENDTGDYQTFFTNDFLMQGVKTGMKQTFRQTENRVAEELDIIEVTPLSEDGRYIEVTFNKPVQKLDRFDIHIIHNESRQRYGVQKVEKQANGYKAVILLHGSAGIKRLNDYVIEITVNEEKVSRPIHWTQFIDKGKIVDLSVQHIKDRTITIKGKGGKEVKITVPNASNFDFVDAYNKELTVEYNGDHEMITYRTLKNDKKIKRKDSFIGQFDLDEYLLIDKLEDNTAFGFNQKLNLERFVFVKDHKLIEPTDIKPGDMLFFNYKEKIAEVYNKTVTGEIERVFDNSLDMNKENYDYNGYFMEDDGDLETFNHKIAEDVDQDITLYLDSDDNIVLVKEI